MEYNKAESTGYHNGKELKSAFDTIGKQMETIYGSFHKKENTCRKCGDKVPVGELCKRDSV